MITFTNLEQCFVIFYLHTKTYISYDNILVDDWTKALKFRTEKDALLYINNNNEDIKEVMSHPYFAIRSFYKIT